MAPEVHPTRDPSALQREVVEFTVSFEPHVPRLVDDVVDGQRAATMGLRGDEDPAERAGERDAASVGVVIALSVVRVPHELPATLPASSLRRVRLAARRGVPLAAVHRSYRLGHAAFQEHMLHHAERTGASTAVVRRVTESLFAYYDWVAPLVEEAYERERGCAGADEDPGALERIEQVLAGAPPPDLDYDLEARHVAVALEGGGAAGLVRRVAAALGAPALVGTTPEGRTWAWLAGPELAADDVVRALSAAGGGAFAGVSEPEAGPHGFLGAHRKAVIALRLGLLRELRVNAYRDVALEALAFGGEDVAADFVRAELGRLAEGDARTAMLRGTLRAYFARGSSTAATARELGIAERTVTYRLRRAEELLGRPAAERRADLETALRLDDVLGAS